MSRSTREILYDDALQMVKHALELAFPVPPQPERVNLKYTGSISFLLQHHEDIEFDKKNREWRDHRKEQIRHRHKIFNQTKKDLNY